jgi:hypothetical protein
VLYYLLVSIWISSSSSSRHLVFVVVFFFFCIYLNLIQEDENIEKLISSFLTKKNKARSKQKQKIFKIVLKFYEWSYAFYFNK